MARQASWPTALPPVPCRVWLEAQFTLVPEMGPHLLHLLVSPSTDYCTLLPATASALNQWLASNASAAPGMMEELYAAYREKVVCPVL